VLAFFDERNGRAYQPSSSCCSEGGLCLVGVEANEMIYADAWDHNPGSFAHMASFTISSPGVTGLTFDSELGPLWAFCDNSCTGRSSVLSIDGHVGSTTGGRFHVARRFERPSACPKRWEILEALCGDGAVSIREAARRVERDVKAVHSDVTALLRAA